jgi:hypothetical protein
MCATRPYRELRKTNAGVLPLRLASLAQGQDDGNLGQRGLEEGDGLEAGDLKAFAAADVLAANEVVGADHVALRLGEAGAIALIGAARHLGLFAADDPPDGILVGLAAVRAGQGVGALFGPLVEEGAFFHESESFPGPRGKRRRGYPWRQIAPKKSIGHWVARCRASEHAWARGKEEWFNREDSARGRHG